MTLLLYSQGFGGWLENHSVDALFRDWDVEKADVLVKALPLRGLLLVDLDPILLLHRIAASLVVAFEPRLIGIVLIGVVQCLAE